MVLTRSARRAAQMLNGTDPLHGTGDDAPAAYAAEPGEECAPTPLAEGRRPMLRKTSSLQRITETVTLIRSESWRHLETQVELIASGQHPLDIQFSFIVAISSLFYLFVSATNYLYGKLSFAALYVVITILSVLADSVCPRNALVNSLDRIFATLGTILSPARVILVPGVACLQVRVVTVLIAIFSFSFLFWSRTSKSQEQYVIRHSLWHAVSALGLTWLAVVDGRGELTQPVSLTFITSLLQR